MTPPSCRCDARRAFALATARFLAGGALLLAALFKLRDPVLFMQSIDAFELVPRGIVPFLAYAIPWTEIAAGLFLVYGFWTRAAAILASLLYVIFTAALAYVLFSGKNIDCGCFGGLFGRGDVGPASLARNLAFLAAAVLVWWRGPGAASLDHVLRTDAPGESTPPPPADAA